MRNQRGMSFILLLLIVLLAAGCGQKKEELLSFSRCNVLLGKSVENVFAELNRKPDTDAEIRRENEYTLLEPVAFNKLEGEATLLFYRDTLTGFQFVLDSPEDGIEFAEAMKEEADKAYGNASTYPAGTALSAVGKAEDLQPGESYFDMWKIRLDKPVTEKILEGTAYQGLLFEIRLSRAENGQSIVTMQVVADRNAG